jgi:hypothetical protein
MPRKRIPLRWICMLLAFSGDSMSPRDVVTGVLDETRFIYFDHDQASGRGGNAVMRSVVAFEAASKARDCAPTSASNGWMFEKSGTHLFLWRWNDKAPKPAEEIEAFADSALKVSRRLQEPASSNRS